MRSLGARHVSLYLRTPGYFCRGLPTDFDSWNLPGWAWDDVLPHFVAIETDLDATSGDYVIVRRDGLPAYHLAVVLDDAEQGVTTIVRGT